MDFFLGKYMMTTTRFYFPTAFNQVQDHDSVTNRYTIPWLNTERLASEDLEAVTESGLYTTSGTWFQRFLTFTNELWCTNFNIPNNGGTVVGIELQTFIQRAARIQDTTVQLILNGQMIGDNYARPTGLITDINTGDTILAESDAAYIGDQTLENTPPLGTPTPDYMIYGKSTDLWGTTGLTAANVSDTSFGVVLKYGSNPTTPHRDLAYLSQIALRITYA